MNYIKKTICALLCFVIIFSICGCSGENSSAIIYYGIAEQPNTVDPQKAESAIELMLVRNTFEGLLRKKSNNEIVNGVITGYEQNGLTYTFHIKPDAVWENGSALTANDFVFALRRAVIPKTASCYVNSLFCIKNAEKINKGQLNKDALGVNAIDEKTLKIELEQDDKNFLSTLTTAICMPCNEEFFNKSVGKYGMTAENTLCNGSYKMKKWVADDFAIRIVKNDEYSGDFKAKNSAVYFSKNKKLDNLKCLDKNYMDIAEIDIKDYNSAITKNYTVSAIKNRVILLKLSKDFSKEMRKALFSCTIENSDFTNNSSLQIAKTVFPDILGVKNIKEFNLFNPKSANSTFYTEYKNLKLQEFPQKTIKYYGDDNTLNVAKCVAGHWQQYLGIYINVAPANSLEGLKYSDETEKYAISVYFEEINQSNTDDYLKKLGAEKSQDYQSIQNKLISDYLKIPLAYTSSFYAYTDDLKNVHTFSDNGIFDFSLIVKED